MNETTEVDLLDKLGYVDGRVEVPLPLPAVVIWGNTVYCRSSRDNRFVEASYYVVDDTRDSGIFKLPE